MRRGYIRERRIGPSLDVQRASLAAAGVDTGGQHAPVYVDVLKPAKRLAPGSDPLPHRALAIKHLRKRDADELVVHDAATLGLDADDIMAALAAIGRVGCKLVVWTPQPCEYVWHPDAAELAGVATEGARIIRSEKHRRAADKHLGVPPKLVGAVLKAAEDAWADPNLTAKQAAARIEEVTGKRVSSRTLYSRLGHKSAAEGKLP